MNELKRIAAIHDLSGVGKCSLTVALPVISASGVECACMPTAILSTHTAVFTGYTVRDLSDDMLPMARHWKREGIHFDALYSGYMISPAQGEIIAEVFDTVSDEGTLKIVDPVMADGGAYYPGFGEEMAAAFRRLCAKADIITPNVTEACFLTGTEFVDGVHDAQFVRELMEKLCKLGSKKIILTGVCPEEGKIGNVMLDCADGEMIHGFYEKLPMAYHGTGDLFSSALAALLVRGADIKDAADCASFLVMEGMKRSVSKDIPAHMGVDFEGILPQYIEKISKLFE